MEGDKEFLMGMVSGCGLALAAFASALVVKSVYESSGYRDKMTIEYHCPEKEYERKIFLDMVNGSGILTNFVDKDCSMNEHMIKYRLTNPK